MKFKIWLLAVVIVCSYLAGMFVSKGGLWWYAAIACLAPVVLSGVVLLGERRD